MTPTPSPEQANGGFDPTKPFLTRDGREVSNLTTFEGGDDLGGFVDGHRHFWHSDGLNEDRDLDLINVAPSPSDPAPVVAPDVDENGRCRLCGFLPNQCGEAECPAWPGPAESDAAFVEQMANRWEPHKSSDRQAGRDIWRLIDLARRVFDPSRPAGVSVLDTPTDTDAAYLARQARDTGIVGPGGPLRRMYLLASAHVEGQKAEPVAWPDRLPCEVVVAPATVIGIGCPIDTLALALSRRDPADAHKVSRHLTPQPPIAAPVAEAGWREAAERLYEFVRRLGIHGPEASSWNERSAEHQALWVAAIRQALPHE